MGLTFKPLQSDDIDHLAAVLRGSWGAGCWCMSPRLTSAQTRALPGPSSEGTKRRAAMEQRASQTPAPGLLAFEDETPIGWVAIAPRTELARVAASRATPPVDDQDVWVIPCITVRKDARGRGIAVALIRAAVAFAGAQGAALVEAYPRAGDTRTGDDNAFFGTEALFRKAGFETVRPPLPDRPKAWPPRPAMRIRTAALKP